MSSNTQLLDSDLVNEWSELLINEQELAASSAHLTHHHHSHHTRQSHIQHQKQILEKGCFIPPNLSSSCIKQQKHLSASSPVENGIPSTPPPSCTPNHLHSNNHSATLNNGSTPMTNWIELKSSTKNKAPPHSYRVTGLSKKQRDDCAQIHSPSTCHSTLCTKEIRGGILRGIPHHHKTTTPKTRLRFTRAPSRRGGSDKVFRAGYAI
ncbi:uncharacterized protein [Lepeophtheirus salmonis]|uniref:uncharacterized protein n=1 Tax=Lepeophtheirus salmonis TaxID=72036 RepID=UPI003AF3D94E